MSTDQILSRIADSLESISKSLEVKKHINIYIQNIVRKINMKFNKMENVENVENGKEDRPIFRFCFLRIISQ